MLRKIRELRKGILWGFIKMQLLLQNLILK